jgi:AcrR family transcriptional regulator
MNRVIEKHELVRIAADLFRMKGYAGTSIDDIAKGCGLTKGSLYHHFAGKEDLALAALDQVHGYYRERIFAIIQERDKPVAKDLQSFNSAVEDFFTAHPYGCLLANLSMESGTAFDAFHRKITLFFNEWVACYTKVFSQYFPPANAQARAEDA